MSIYVVPRNHIADDIASVLAASLFGGTVSTLLTLPLPIATMVKSMRFGDLEVPVPGFGAMGISFALGNDLSYEQAEPVLLKALEQGCTFWDTAVRPN